LRGWPASALRLVAISNTGGADTTSGVGTSGSSVAVSSGAGVSLPCSASSVTSGVISVGTAVASSVGTAVGSSVGAAVGSSVISGTGVGSTTKTGSSVTSGVTSVSVSSWAATREVINKKIKTAATKCSRLWANIGLPSGSIFERIYYTNAKLNATIYISMM